MERHALKIVNTCQNGKNYSNLETTCGQSSNLYLNVVQFSNTSVYQTSVAAKDSCFPALVSNIYCNGIAHFEKVNSCQNTKIYSYLVTPGANVIKLFTVVTYCHSMVIPSFCVIKLYYLGNYLGMAVNYHGIKLFYNIGQKCLHSVSYLKYHGNFLW